MPNRLGLLLLHVLRRHLPLSLAVAGDPHAWFDSGVSAGAGETWPSVKGGVQSQENAWVSLL